MRGSIWGKLLYLAGMRPLLLLHFPTTVDLGAAWEIRDQGREERGYKSKMRWSCCRCDLMLVNHHDSGVPPLQIYWIWFIKRLSDHVSLNLHFQTNRGYDIVEFS